MLILSCFTAFLSCFSADYAVYIDTDKIICAVVLEIDHIQMKFT